MANLVIDGDYSDAESCSAPELSAPLDGVNEDYVLQQDFIQSQAGFTPLVLSTPHPDFPDFVLVSEGPKDDVAPLTYRWTRTYARVPATYTEPGGNFPYTFPGYYGTFGVGIEEITGRDTFNRNVPLIVTYDFFLVGPGQTYTTFQAIPKIAATRFEYDPGLDVNFLSDAGSPFVNATVPSRTEYIDMTDDDLVPASFSIVIEESIIERWMGMIFRRTTRRVKAI